MPEAGGLLDQPAGLVKKMTVVTSVYEAFKGFHGAGNLADWADHHRDSWDLVEKVMELRRQACQ